MAGTGEMVGLNATERSGVEPARGEPRLGEGLEDGRHHPEGVGPGGGPLRRPQAGLHAPFSPKGRQPRRVGEMGPDPRDRPRRTRARPVLAGRGSWQLSCGRRAVRAAADGQGSGYRAAFLGVAFLPAAFLPAAFLPRVFLAAAFLPRVFLAAAFLRDAFLVAFFLRLAMT
jgi:hypothetical protein